MRGSQHSDQVTDWAILCSIPGRRQYFISLPKSAEWVLWPTWLSAQCKQRVLSVVARRPGREDHH
jgi:hypothetical protein